MAQRIICLSWWVLERWYRNQTMIPWYRRGTGDIRDPHVTARKQKEDAAANWTFWEAICLSFMARTLCSPCSHPGPSAQCSEQPRSPRAVALTLGVTRCLCKLLLQLFSTGEPERESPPYTKGQNGNTLCGHSNPEILRLLLFRQKGRNIFPTSRQFSPSDTIHLYSSLYFKSSIAKKQQNPRRNK